MLHLKDIKSKTDSKDPLKEVMLTFFFYFRSINYIKILNIFM